MLNKQKVLGLVAAATMGFAGAASAADQTFVTIGTGGVTGVYYPTGGAICRLVNKNRKEHGIRCSVESTGGSVYNTRTIRQGELDFGIVQSDVQAAAVAGTGKFADDGAFPELRALFSVHPEPMHLMARSDAGIATTADLKGKRVNIANPGSGTRVLAETLMKYEGLTTDDFSLAAELKSSEQSAALCDGKIEATIWAAGLPNGSSQEATSSCDVTIIPLTGAGIDKLLAENSAYAAATIPGGMYPNNADDIPSWGPKATFVTSANTSDEVAYAVVSAVFDNFDAFKKLHPAFGRLQESEMIVDGLTADLHPGALKYYKERGWK
ncbi:TAXI family TRAP transporter solute-binding subunit [Shimia thalassica]|jgi:TRAP transporter TAXI family solute receptor|uniref:TRAP transporter solute receptor, TAXI family n=1 Tax=Shimia thalassica TaxID=1715693 RepID=A0A0P1IKM3_9RHOB|nr:TAXI family TRAP transporter solute-binding subunit [Shimia thalassica]MBU2944911.1 TAXI family TRAP transporter solute-binding subunit [Shimia thalassica]MDO6481114.1 TAXI family TRAP transporter solute-binding subunit [Shimia thalassica]MDO6484978.1 TAXI family TRAP transporter solute-binding subunit [Shimia thalassica]MDO6504783.1 TAXI family TRAP transporter solute-binding subunit [Shimia thalassica]MDO6523636.1 TAXI family TRAP transporter solute-binding subunit [Shimia thalassica]